jgi:hypothetical protein
MPDAAGGKRLILQFLRAIWRSQNDQGGRQATKFLGRFMIVRRRIPSGAAHALR